MTLQGRQTVEFTIILPGHNEEDTVAEAVEKCHAALTTAFDSFEILLINDCSTDRTGERLEEAARIYPEIQVCHNTENMGQAVSLIKGFQKARGDIVMHNAFDLPFNPVDISKVKSAMSDGTDVLVVEREGRTSYSAYRKFVSHTNVMLLKILFQCPFDDYNFVQAYRRPVLDTIPIKTRAVGSVTPELIIRAYRSEFSVKSVKLPYYARKTGKSSVGVADTFDSLVETLRLWWLLRMGN